jgi:hypothetical protein
MNKEQAQEIVRDLITKSQERFKQELIGENEEMLDRVLRQYRAKVARQSWKLSQKWSKWDAEGPVLMPDYTRIYYRKGKTEIILQEFPPQVRLMKFRGSLVSRKNTDEVLEPKEDQKVHTHLLALPYVVFVFKFIDGNFSEVRCAFNDRPLKRLEERPLRPYLANIDSGLSVCLGTSIDKKQLIKGQLTQQVAFILDHFWHTAYSDEWSGHFWANRAHFQDDARMSSVQNWSKATVENSLFVIEDVNWLQHAEESFGDMIVKMLQDDSDNMKLQDDLYESLADTFFEEIKKAVQENTKTIGDKLSDQQIDELSDELLTKCNLL